MKKRLLTMLEVLLSVSMVLIPMAVTASAENGPARTDTALMSEETVSVGRIDVAGQDDMGRLFTNAIEQQESGNSGPEDEELYRIRNVAVEDSSVTAEYTAAADCYLRIEILHETEETLLASETVQAAADQQQLTLTIGLLDPENENHPDYFILRAYLEEQEPEQEPVVRDSFETFAYTGKWQDFYSKTADDFDADRVVNLDEDKNSNFAVYNDDVVICKRQGNGNMLLVNDPAQQRYVIANPDTELLALTAGDILVLQYNDSDSIITRVQSSAVGNGTVTVIGNNDLTPDDVFSYAKIEMAADQASAEIDDSVLPDCVVYEGIVTKKNTSSSACASEAAVLAGGDPVTADYEKSFRFKIGKSTESSDEESSDTGYISAQGSLNLILEQTHKFSVTYYRDNYFKELKLEYELNTVLQGEASAAAELNVPLAAFTYKLGKLGKVDLSPYLNLSIEGKAVFDAVRITSSIGVSVQNNKLNMESGNDLSFGNTKLEVDVFAGFKINPTCKMLDFFKIGIEGKLGAEVTAEKAIFSPTSNDEERHTCRNCISGTASASGQLTGSVSFMNACLEGSKKYSYKLYDWYYSGDHKELGFGECPYREYRCTIRVRDEDGQPVSGAVINETFLTDEKGETVIYLSREPTKLTAVKYPMRGSMIAGTDKPQVFEIIISYRDPDDDDDDDPGEISDYDQLCSEGYVLVCDEATKTCMIDLYYGGQAELVIPSGVIYHNTVCRVVTLDSRSFSKYGTNLVKVTIPGSVRYIGECAFSGCVNLKNVTVKKGVMDIADGAFMDCTNLESVSLPDTVEHVGYTAFARCYNLRSIDLSGASTIAYGAFMNCSKLGKLTLSAGSLRHIGDYAFYNCERLQTVVFSDRTSPASTEDDANIPYYCITRNKAIPDGDYLGTGAFGAGSSTEPFPAYVEITADAGQLNDFSFDLLLRCALESIEADEENKTYYTVDGVLYDREKKELLCCPDQHIGNVTVPDEVSSVGRKAFAGGRVTESLMNQRYDRKRIC